jgi:hypothetical protein
LVTSVDTGEMIIEPDDQVYGIDSRDPADMELGADGAPLVPGNVQSPRPEQMRPETVRPDGGPQLDQEWLDRTLNDGQRQKPQQPY